MKHLLRAATLAAAMLSFTACNKQYDTVVSDSHTNNNSGSSGFSWTGTAPMSAKVNGVPFLATSITVTDQLGFYGILGQEGTGQIVIPQFPINALPGHVYSIPTPANMTWQQSMSGTFTLGGTAGKIKIITNNSTTLEGYFWADVIDYSHQKDTIIHITEGYFKVDKP